MLYVEDPQVSGDPVGHKAVWGFRGDNTPTIYLILSPFATGAGGSTIDTDRKDGNSCFIRSRLEPSTPAIRQTRNHDAAGPSHLVLSAETPSRHRLTRRLLGFLYSWHSRPVGHLLKSSLLARNTPHQGQRTN